MKQVIFPISADPLTYGHLNIIEKAVAICEERCILVILDNYQKTPLFPLPTRRKLTEKTIQAYFQSSEKLRALNALEKLQVVSWEGMLHEFILQEGIFHIVRGIRHPEDLHYEKTIRKGYLAQVADSDTELHFIYLLCDEIYQDISSSLTKNILLHGGEISSFVPPLIKKALEGTCLQQHKIIVTGSIGSGKSTVIPLLITELKANSLDAHYINMDEIVKQLYEKMEAGELKALAKKLTTYFKIKPPVSKEIIRSLIFDTTKSPATPAQKHLKFLEETLAPYIKNEYRQQIRGKKGIIFIEAAQAAEYHLISESNGDVLFVTCSVAERESRLIKQRHLKPAEATQRMKLSATPDEKLQSIHAQIKTLQTGTLLTYDNTPTDDFTALPAFIKKFIKEFKL